MEEKLITAVSGFPVIYDPDHYNYKDMNARNDAWRFIAATIGESDDTCKKRWRNLRDVYLRGRRKKKAKISVGTKTPWRYMAAMSFLAPFVERRQMYANEREAASLKMRAMTVRSLLSQSSSSLANTNPTTSPPQASQPAAAVERSSPSAAGTPEASQPEASKPEATKSEATKPEASKPEASKSEASKPEASKPEASKPEASKPEASQLSRVAKSASYSATVSRPVPSIPQSTRFLVANTLFGGPQPLMRQITTSRPNKEPDEDELFFKSLLPDLRSLPRQRKALVKLKIHQLIFEAMQEDIKTVDSNP